MEKTILKYFTNLTDTQIEQFKALKELYQDWNSKINVISRKDIENLYEHHILHSTTIAKFINFKAGSSVMDIGTGGGFPGIPLAILFPNVKFHLIDSINKKLKVVDAVSKSIGLKNITTSHTRIQEEKEKFDFIVSRAVMSFPELVQLCKKNISKQQQNALPNGIICLKGGDLEEELKSLKNNIEITNITDYFKEDFFETKKLIYLPL